MGEAKYMVAWPAGRLGFQKKRAAPHPCGGYIIGIGILLDVFSVLWVVFSLLWGEFSLLWVAFQ